MPLRSCFLAALVALILGGPARADFVFEFAQGGTFGNAFTVNQGGTVPIQVYLAQTNGSTNLTTAGLMDGGVSLQFSSSAPFTLSSASNITPNSQFSGPNNTSVTTSSGTTTGTLQVHGNTPVLATTTDPSGNAAVLLGTFNFSGVTPGPGITVTAFPNATNNNVDGNFVDLDTMIHQSTVAITVVAVPEPGSMILCSLAVAGFGAGVLRRRFLRKQEAAAAAV